MRSRRIRYTTFRRYRRLPDRFAVAGVFFGCATGVALPHLRCSAFGRGLRGDPLQNVAGYYAAARATSRSPIIVLPVLTWSGATTRNLEVRSLSNPLVPLTLVHYQLYSDIVRKQYYLAKKICIVEYQDSSCNSLYCWIVPAS